MKFNEFVEAKERVKKKRLAIVKKMLEASGLNVIDKTNNKNDEAFIYVYNSGKNLPFDGIRVYEIAGQFAYRVQKEVDTQPYGKAYSISIESMFEDLLGEDMPDEKIGHEIIRSVVNEIKDFFDRSYEAEQHERPADPLNRVVDRSSNNSNWMNQWV